MLSILNNTIILIDGSASVYRGYYAYNFLKNNFNEPTGAIYSILNMLQILLKEHKPKYIAIIFDAKGSNFRNKIFKNYKCNRNPMPKDLKFQIDKLFKIFKYIGIKVFSIPGVEGDDVIGTLAIESEKQGKKVLISTNDKDISQLVTHNISIINNTNNYIYGYKEIESKYGFKPELIVDYLSLVGDKADNIPGVLGIGKKTATLLIQKLGDINFIYKNLNKINNLFKGSKKIISKLKNDKEIALISYKLATIKTNLQINKNLNLLVLNDVILKKLKYFYDKYNFKKKKI